MHKNTVLDCTVEEISKTLHKKMCPRVFFFFFTFIYAIFNAVDAVVLPQSGVPPEFQRDRNCYPWYTPCNNISYSVQEPTECYRCCLTPTSTTSNAAIATQSV
ncbi:hypothetical protein CPB84DRAFT_1763926, partial [Gymnopilus junonius]